MYLVERRHALLSCTQVAGRVDCLIETILHASEDAGHSILCTTTPLLTDLHFCLRSGSQTETSRYEGLGKFGMLI